MSDAIDRAAEVVAPIIANATACGYDPKGTCGTCRADSALIAKALADAGLLADIDLSIDIETTATGQRCTVKRSGITIFKGVSLEATLTTEAHDRQVAAKALREAATDAAYGIDWDDVPESVESWLRDRADRIERGE